MEYGKALWSAMRERKKSEEKVKMAKNRIRKLEADEKKLGKSLAVVLNKSQRLTKCQQAHRNVLLMIIN